MSWNPSTVCGPIPSESGLYLLNLAPELMRPVLEPFRVFPVTPDVVWAGDADMTGTIFLRFAGEAGARAALPELWVDATA